MSIQPDFPELLRWSRGSGRRLTMFPRGWVRCRSRCLLLLLHLLVMVLVLRGGLGSLSGLVLRPICFSRRSCAALRLGGRWSLRRRGGGALRLIGRRSLRRRCGSGLCGILRHYRQRQRKHDERSQDNCQ